MKQTRLAAALLGNQTGHTGLARSLHYRWFTLPVARSTCPDEDREERSALIAAHLNSAYTRGGPGSRAAEIVEALQIESPEFACFWRSHPVRGPYCGPERIRHSEVGLLELDPQGRTP